MEKNLKQRILLGFSAAFIVPPFLWFVSLWYYSILTFKELLMVMSTPEPWIYIASSNAIVCFLVSRKLKLISNYMENPDITKTSYISKIINSIPKFFIGALIVFCLIGPNAGLIGAILRMNFISKTEYIFSELTALPIILVFMIPFFAIVSTSVEKWTYSIPLVKNIKYISLKFKLL